MIASANPSQGAVTVTMVQMDCFHGNPPLCYEHNKIRLSWRVCHVPQMLPKTRVPYREFLPENIC